MAVRMGGGESQDKDCARSCRITVSSGRCQRESARDGFLGPGKPRVNRRRPLLMPDKTFNQQTVLTITFACWRRAWRVRRFSACAKAVGTSEHEICNCMLQAIRAESRTAAEQHGKCFSEGSRRLLPRRFAGRLRTSLQGKCALVRLMGSDGRLRRGFACRSLDADAGLEAAH